MVDRILSGKNNCGKLFGTNSLPAEFSYIHSFNVDKRPPVNLEIIFLFQLIVRGPFWFGLSDAELAAVYPYEDWVLARSLVKSQRAAGEYEDDLFADIRVTS